METDELILQTAREHFVKHGYAGTRMQEIADEAGINKAMLHYYFRSKDQLYRTIIGQILDQIIPKFAATMGEKCPFWEKLERLVHVYIVTLCEQPDIPFFIMSELSQQRERFLGELRKKADHFPSVQTFLVQIADEVKSKKIRSIPPLHLLLNIIGMTVFPFMARPIFQTVFAFPADDFINLMKEREKIILDFVRNALDPGPVNL